MVGCRRAGGKAKGGPFAKGRPKRTKEAVEGNMAGAPDPAAARQASSESPSIDPQGGDRVQPARSARGQVAGEQRDCHEKPGCGRESDRVAGVHLV